MSQMPDKIWLHKNTKYSTGDMVCGYQYNFVQGIEDEGGIENFVEYVPVNAFIEKACEFLYDYNKNMVKKHGARAVLGCSEFTINVYDFKKYMEGE
jgi:hypothetical protein